MPDHNATGTPSTSERLLKLNLGCGSDHRKGFVNVDLTPACQPDVVFNLESGPWPWRDNSVEEVVFHHCLEHLGQTSAAFLAIIQELYRVCADGALVRIVVPHPRHDFFIGDPTHVRPVTPWMLALFDRELNLRWQQIRAANTPLALYLNVDFHIEHVETILEEPYRSDREAGRVTQEELDRALHERFNVASEFRIRLRARKSA